MVELNKCEKAINALENCLDVPKCKNCPWETCETEHETVELPRDLVEWALLLIKASAEVKLNLCDSCRKIYPSCDAVADGMKFGCGTGNDNVIECSAYEQREPLNHMDLFLMLNKY